METLLVSKAALDEAKRMLDFSKNGYKLLDRKRNVLMQTLLEEIERAEAIYKRYEEAAVAFQRAFLLASLERGEANLKALLPAIELKEVERLPKSVMGVQILHFFFERCQDRLKASYGLFRSSARLDAAFLAAEHYRDALLDSVEVDMAMDRLMAELERSSRRADALKRIQIPRYEAMVAKMRVDLEEKEREDLFRLKMMKKKHANA